VRYAVGLGATLLAPMLCSRPASAHARWFVDDRQLPPGPEFQLDRIYASILVAAFIFVICAMFLESASRRHPAFHRVLRQPMHASSNAVWRILSIAFGLTLIINSMTRVLVAPNLPAGQGLTVHAVMFLQILIGSMFAIQSRVMLGSALVVLLPLFCWWMHSFVHAIDYAFELVGFSAALYLVGPSLSAADRDLQGRLFAWSPVGLTLRIRTRSRSFCCAWRTSRHDEVTLDCGRRERLAVSILRTLLGLQLVVLAAHDKLLQPAVSLAFVDKYPFNFPALLGATSFTNLHFVFGAGVAEIVLGALLMGNIATRAACGMLAAMFVTTGIMFDVGELVGHLPIVAALLVLVTHGCGKAVSPLTFDPWQRAFLGAAGLATTVLLFAVFAPGSHPARVSSADASRAAPVAACEPMGFTRLHPASRTSCLPMSTIPAGL
jgi:hypothetical protein